MACSVPITDVAKAIYCLEEDGGVIVTGFATVEEVNTVNDDAAPYLEAVANEVAPPKILFGRSETAREKWLQRREVHQILDHFLRTTSIPYNDQGGCVIQTDPILSAATTMQISPGEQAQDLHRDDFIWQRTHIRSEGSFEPGSDVGMGILVPGTRTIAANGATVVRRPEAKEVQYAEMSVGDAFLFLGSTVHGGGMNTTGRSRTVHGFFFCRSWMRPEENQFLWWTKEEIEAWSTTAQKQAGYLLGNPFLGHCDDSDPLKMFRASEPLTQRRAA
ncbi:MAG: hypothetical protein LQ348_003516 [Seirophora lacunosa]|nr:MAG: hypothetical protein LQ348_003516 [Seirophora lacunosa]